MLFTRSAARSLVPASSRWPLHACAILAGAALLPLACADHDTTAPVVGTTGSMARPSAVGPAALSTAATAMDPIFIESLTGRYPFTDQVAVQMRIKLDGRATNVVNTADPSNVTTLRITVQPNARFPWHTHPGPVVVSVVEGELTLVYADDCERRPYAQATFVDPGNSVHMAYNGGTTETVLIATFFGAPDSGPVTLAVPDAQQSALNTKCSTPAAALQTR